jgi:hypothetical protein
MMVANVENPSNAMTAAMAAAEIKFVLIRREEPRNYQKRRPGLRRRE